MAGPPESNALPRASTIATAKFAADVAYYLNQQPRQLPSRYLYDALGSALFDAICRLPWYKVTRAEAGLLARHGSDILAALEPLGSLVELGAGNGEKLAVLLSARPPEASRLPVHLVDVSRAALDAASAAIKAVADVEVVTHEARFLEWLRAARGQTASPGAPGRTLALFLGSNIGNFDPPAAAGMLTAIRGALAPGDALLLGADLVKPEPDLMLAYDDPLGVTAAFNRNLLVRMNQELDADFDLAHFRHCARWNPDASRIEMHLVSTCAQRVRVGAAEVDMTLREGETIWTESSHKYSPEQVTGMLERAGFNRRSQWTDADAGFALTLGEASGA